MLEKVKIQAVDRRWSIKTKYDYLRPESDK
jgi:hypothetical protein